MSTILKALRRLEEERESQARDLRDQVLARPRTAVRPRLPLLMGAGAVGALIVVGGFMLVGGRRLGSEVAAPVPLASGPTASAAAPVASRPVAKLPAPVASRPVAKLPAPVASRLAPAALRKDSPSAARVVTTETATRRPELREAPRTSPPREVASASPRPASAPRASAPAPARTTVASSARPVSSPTVASAPPKAEAAPAPIAVASVAAAPHPAPVAAPPPSSEPAVAEPATPAREVPGIVGQPTVARRARMPHIVVERTLWHPKAERRLALLHVEGREGIVELHEGDAFGDTVVQQIEPSAVVFLHRGVEIRRRIGDDS